jgi:hypothetical protein
MNPFGVKLYKIYRSSEEEEVLFSKKRQNGGGGLRFHLFQMGIIN